MKRAVFAVICLTVLMIISGCSGSGSGAPSGAVMTLTPSDKITVESASSTIETASQTFRVSVKDSKATNAPGVRDVTFSISFGFANPPDTNILSDATSAVTLCDGTRIVGTPVTRMTDNQGNYDVCVLYKSGGGLAYSGSLVVSSGDQSPSVNLDVTSKPLALAVSPKDPAAVPAGSIAEFTIVGGVPPYIIKANPSSVLPPVPSAVNASSGTFSVGIPLGTPDKTSVVYTITDAIGAQVTTTLTVGQPSLLPQVFPDTSNVLPGGAAQFMIVNGFPEYTIVSDNALVQPSPATVAASGGTFSAAVPLTIQTPSTVKFTIRDTAGSTVTATLNVVEPPKPVLSPTFVSVVSGGSALFSITGGIAPYTVTTTDASILPVPTTVLNSGGTFRVSVPLSASTGSVTVTVTDALGAQVSATMSVTAASQQLTISPSTVPPVSAVSGGSPSFTVTGGTPPYSVVSSDAARAFFGTVGTGSISNVGANEPFTVTVPVSATPGTVTLTVTDSAGGNKTVSITIQ
ncbi:MAG: hypothetical protein M0Z71_11445 [Nitrospiraceae bacterium]|nr:hypothetical protein [Nitrospiraceae bacterium]